MIRTTSKFPPSPEQVGQVAARLRPVLLHFWRHRPLHLHRMPVPLRHHLQQHALLLWRHDVPCNPVELILNSIDKLYWSNSLVRLKDVPATDYTATERPFACCSAINPMLHTYVQPRLRKLEPPAACWQSARTPRAQNPPARQASAG